MGRLDNIKAWRLKLFPAWDLDQKNTFGSTALSVAAYLRQNKLDVVKVLLAKGADLWCRTDGGGTALSAAASSADADPAVVKLIMEELARLSCAAHPVAVEVNRPYKGQTVKMRAVQALFEVLYRSPKKGE